MDVINCIYTNDISIKPDTYSSLEYHLGDDSDVECLGTYDPIHEVNDTLTSQELCLGYDQQASQTAAENRPSQSVNRTFYLFIMFTTNLWLFF